MITDPIVEKLHQQRKEYMERFQYDFDAIVRDIKARETSQAGPLLQPPPEAQVGSKSVAVPKRTVRGR